MEKKDRTSEIDQAWVRPKISRTTREARRTAGETDTPDRTEHPVPQDQGDPDDHGGARPMPQRGGSRQPEATSSHNLRAVGPFISHFSGRVVQVFGTSQRPMPSTAPLQLAAFLFFVAIMLPYVVALLPMVVVLLIAWLWLRRRGWIRGRPRLPRLSNRSASDVGLLVTSFRVRVSRDPHETEESREIDCRLVQRADLGPAPLVGGELVIGRGRRTGQGVVEVSRLRMPDSGTTLRTTSPKSWLSVLMLASLIVAAGAVLLYVQRTQIPPVDVEAILSILSLVLACLFLIYLIKMTLRRLF